MGQKIGLKSPSNSLIYTNSKKEQENNVDKGSLISNLDIITILIQKSQKEPGQTKKKK